LVFDPKGLLIGLGIGAAISLATGAQVTGPVVINFMPATNVGTNAKGMGHFLIPPGASWAPMPKFPKPSFKEPPTFPGPPVKPEDDAIAIQGSQTVNIVGASGVRTGEMFMSCGEPLRIPSSKVIAIPKGPPVMVGGPPAVNLLTAAMAMIKTKWVAGYLHSLIERIANDRIRGIFTKAACFLTGHPVDVATGRVLTDHVDWQLPGPLPLKFERSYSSAFANRGGPLGHGWSHSLDQALWSERGKIVYLADDGREIEFDTFDFPKHQLPPATDLFEPINRLTLRLDGKGGASVTTHDGIRHDFVPIPGSSNERKSWLRLKRMSNRAGHAIELDYDQRGNLEWVRDSGGRQVCFEHDTQGRMTVVKLPHPSDHGWLPHTRYAYDAKSDLVQITDPLGHSWKFAYKNHLLVRETDRNGLSFYFAYDGHGQEAFCVRTWGDGGIYDHVIDYDKQGKATFVTNSLGQTTTYHLNAIGLVTKVVDPLGSETSYEYHEPSLQRSKITLPDGSERAWSYDRFGRQTAVVAADGARIELTYDPAGNLVKTLMPTGGAWTWRHDHQGRITERIDPLGQSTRYVYDPQSHLLTAIEDGRGRLVSLLRDAELNITQVVRSDGSVRRYAYDRLGRMTAIVGERNHSEHRYYDGLNRLLRVEAPLRDAHVLDYDPEGCLLRFQAGNRIVELAYTGMRRVARRTEAGRAIQFRYDSEDNLAEVDNELGETMRYRRDDCGRVTRREDFDGSIVELKLDSMGRVVGTVAPSGATIETSYDAMGRPTKILFPDGSKRSFTYRPDGLLTEAATSDHVVKLERDELGRVVREIEGNHWVESTFSTRGQRVELRTSLGLEQTIARSPMGLAQQVELRLDERTWSVDFERDAAGLEVKRRLKGAVVTTERDELGRPTLQSLAVGSRPPEVWAHHWNTANRLESRINAATGPTHLLRDPLGRLVEVAPPEGAPEILARDAVGNSYETPERADRRYGPGARLLEWQGQPVGHDLDGHVTELPEQNGGRWTYHYADTGELKTVVRPDGQSVGFRYDALGRRISKTTATGETTWLWDGNNPIHEVTATGATAWVFEPDSQNPLARVVGTSITNILCDYLGTPHILVADSGQSSSLTIDGHGRLRENDVVPWFPWRFAGQYADHETGLSYNRYRYYHPGLGRYLAKDPVGPFGGLNLYAYVRDPFAAIDPFGLIEEWGVAPYGASTHGGDGLDAHELLQSAWLKKNAPDYEGRGTGIGRQNPAMGIDPEVHGNITAAQREAGLLESENLGKMTAQRNIAMNAEILEAEMVAQGMHPAEAAQRVKAMRKESEAYAESVGCGK
jgi:RHS repeat-associated protein